MKNLYSFMQENYEWLIPLIGVFLTGIIAAVKSSGVKQSQKSADNSTNIQIGRDANIRKD